jgi:hypothetical protein
MSDERWLTWDKWMEIELTKDRDAAYVKRGLTPPKMQSARYPSRTKNSREIKEK